MSQVDVAASLEPEARALRLMRPAQARRYSVIPLRREASRLTLAMSNTSDLGVIEELEFLTGLRILPVQSSATAIARAIERYYRSPRLPVLSAATPLDQSGEMPVVRVQRILFSEANRLGASDIHIDPGERMSRVRYRVDGLLRDTFEIPRWLHERLVTRVKVIAGLDIVEHRLPQDGHLTDRSKGFEARLSTLPTHLGEAIVIRLFGDRQGLPSLAELGAGADVETRLRAISQRPQGILVVAGPTGSGKTTTLYAIINELRDRSLNIVTIENPIEYRVDGVRQVQVDERSKLTFEGALRSALRQDPDVLLVGEVRDSETARTAFNAALTGHLVLSTLHATGAVSTLLRLVELGVDRGVIASAMIGAVAQRLVRRNCPKCLQPDSPPSFYLDRLGIPPSNRDRLRSSRGCIECNFDGTSGRGPLFEVLELNQNTREHVLAGRDAELRAAALTAGFVPVMDQAVGKVLAGEISTAEAYRSCYAGNV